MHGKAWLLNCMARLPARESTHKYKLHADRINQLTIMGTRAWRYRCFNQIPHCQCYHSSAQAANKFILHHERIPESPKSTAQNSTCRPQFGSEKNTMEQREAGTRQVAPYESACKTDVGFLCFASMPEEVNTTSKPRMRNVTLLTFRQISINDVNLIQNVVQKRAS